MLLLSLKVLLLQVQPSQSHRPPRPSRLRLPERMPRAVRSAGQLWRSQQSRSTQVVHGPATSGLIASYERLGYG